MCVYVCVCVCACHLILFFHPLLSVLPLHLLETTYLPRLHSLTKPRKKNTTKENKMLQAARATRLSRCSARGVASLAHVVDSPAPVLAHAPVPLARHVFHPAYRASSRDPFWRNVPVFSKVATEDFLSYQWSVSVEPHNDSCNCASIRETACFPSLEYVC